MSFNKYKAAMEYNRLGEAGVLVSKLSFGCMTFSDDPKNLVGKSQFSTPEVSSSLAFAKSPFLS